MARPRPPYLVRQVTRHKRTVWYVRIGAGPRTRIHSAYGTPEFMAEYQAAIMGAAAPVKPAKEGRGTLAWLIARYHESSVWASLAPATRRQRENILKHVIAQSGDVPFSAVTRAKIVEGRERRKATPAQANVFIKVMRGLFDWALDLEHVSENPARDVKFVAVKTDGFHTWTESELDRYEAHWPLGTRERLAYDVLLYTGLRRGDAVALGPKHVRFGVFKIETEKTGTIVEARILPPLARSIAAGPVGAETFIVGERKNPMSKEGFTNWFRGACEAAGVPGSAHGLRKAGAVRASLNGASNVELRSMFGWTGDKMPSLYTKAADRVLAAETGMLKLERRQYS